MKRHRAFLHRSLITWSRFNLHNKQGEKYDVFIEFPQKRLWLSHCLHINSTNKWDIVLSLSEKATFWVKIFILRACAFLQANNCTTSAFYFNSDLKICPPKLSFCLKNDLNQNLKMYNHSKLFLFKSLAKRRQKKSRIDLVYTDLLEWPKKVSQVYLQCKRTQAAKKWSYTV